MPRHFLPTTFAIVLLASCQAPFVENTSAEDTLNQYIKAVQTSNVDLQKRLSCDRDGEVGDSLHGIGEWEVVSTKLYEDGSGAIFFVRSNSQTWQVAIRDPEATFQEMLELANRTNALVLESHQTQEQASRMFGETPPPKPEVPSLPRREDYSQEPYCVSTVNS